MPEIIIKTPYETVVKEYKIKKHYKNIDEISYDNETITLLETEDLAYEQLEDIDEIVIVKPKMVNITKSGGGASLERKGGCVSINFHIKGFKTEKILAEKILICSEEFKTEINKSKLNKLVDKITYP